MFLIRAICLWVVLLNVAACASQSINTDRLGSLPCETSLTIFDSIKNVDPNFFDKDVYLYYQYSYCLGTNGRAEEAINPMLIFLNHFPDDLNAKMLLGNFYNSTGNFENALKQFMDVSNINPEYGDVNYNIAIAYFNLDRLQDALKYADLQLINSKNRDIEAELLRCEILAKLEQWKTTVKCYKEIPLNAFDFYEIKYYVEALKRVGKYADAEHFLINLAIKNPNRFDIFNELALLTIENNNFVRAKAYLHKSKDIEESAKQNPILYIGYSKYHLALNNLDSCCYFVENFLPENMNVSGQDSLQLKCCK